MAKSNESVRHIGSPSEVQGTVDRPVIKKKSTSRWNARNVMVTINGTHDMPTIDMTRVKYYVFGREVAPTTGTKHLQGYVEFNRTMRRTSILKALGVESAHIEKRMGTQQEAIDYCKKDGDICESGRPKKNGRPKSQCVQDHHDNLQEVIEMVDEGKTDLEICEEEPGLWYKYKTYITDLKQLREEKRESDEMKDWATEVELNPDQKYWWDQLQGQNDRQVMWIDDRKGGLGKSLFSKWLITTQSAIRFTNAKTADISYAYNGEEYVIIDLSRTVEGRVNYGVIEDLKNGMLFSGKYKSRSKVFARPPKICIMANFGPEFGALSQDRWQYMFKDPILKVWRGR